MKLFLILMVVLLFYGIFTSLLRREDIVISRLKSRLSRVFPNITDLYIINSTKSLTRSKQDIYLQVYNKNGVPFDMNTLVYVALHEISHIICEVEDTDSAHSPEFYAIFNKLIDKSIEKGIFNPSYPLNGQFLS